MRSKRFQNNFGMVSMTNLKQYLTTNNRGSLAKNHYLSAPIWVKIFTVSPKRFFLMLPCFSSPKFYGFFECSIFSVANLSVLEKGESECEGPICITDWYLATDRWIRPITAEQFRTHYTHTQKKRKNIQSVEITHHCNLQIFQSKFDQDLAIKFYR